ncbi:MAG: PhnD/SsuA/transferrin family substrate-binding protein [Anaerolineales bacterium]
MAHDVFISYSTKDKTVADTIAASLEGKQIRCWYAPRDIKAGADWGEEIAQAINASTIFLLIFSSSANQSQRVLDELNLAITKEAVILPFRIEKLDPSGAMQLHLSSRHWLDAFLPSWEKHIDNLVNSVFSNLETGESTAAVDYARSFDQTSKPKKRKLWLFGAVGTVVIAGLGAIFGLPKLFGPPDIIPTELAPTVTTHSTAIIPTDTSVPTPILPTLGSAEAPLIWMYVPRDDIDFNEVSTTVDEIVKDFQEINPNLSLKIIPATNEITIIEALCAGEAHIGSLNAFTFMAASSRDCAEAKLIWSAYGDINVGGMIVTNADSGITDISALEGQPLCIPNYTSTSGWVLPSLEIQASIERDPDSFFSEIIEKNGHDKVIWEVYNGNCIAGTAFYDARLNYSDIPDINDRVVILSTTTSVPLSNFSFSKIIPPELSQKLIAFFLNSAELDNLSIICGYSHHTNPIKLIEINDYYYNEIWDLFQRAGENPEDYLR